MKKKAIKILIWIAMIGIIMICIRGINSVSKGDVYRDYPGPWIYWGSQIRWVSPKYVEVYINRNFNDIAKYQGFWWWDKPKHQIRRGIAQWNNVGNCDFRFRLAGEVNENAFTQDGRNVVSGASAHDVRGAVALTRIMNQEWNFDANRWNFLEVDIGFNRELTWSSINQCPSDAYDVWNAASHELGHLAGLADMYSWESRDHTMHGWITVDPNETIKRDLHEHDKEGLRRIYPEPAFPTNLNAEALSKSEIELTWNDESIIESGYEVYRNGSRITTLSANTTSYKDTGLSANTTYRYRVRAYRVKNGTTYYSLFSNEAQATTPADGDGGGDGCLAQQIDFLKLFSEDEKEIIIKAYKNLKDLHTEKKNTIINILTSYQQQVDILLKEDNILRTQFKILLEKLMYSNIEKIANNQKEQPLSKEDINSLIEFFDRLSQRASKQFKKDIEEIKKIIKKSQDKTLKEILLSEIYIPSEVKLLQTYPNPANPECYIPFELPDEAEVVIRIYTITGQLIRTLNLGRLPRGRYISPGEAAYWDGKDDKGNVVSSGVYIYQIKVNDRVLTKKLVILK